MSSLPYHEPPILTILINSSFLLLLNITDSILDNLLYCGLLGQILLGIAYGAPGGQLLPLSTQQTIVDLGYLGLILLVYSGGLSVSLTTLKANLWLSTAVALTGILAPIGLSYLLLPLVGATPLQAFAAGAALCSTSLGTAFTVLRTCGLERTRIGSVLATAAMMDDVVGLVMVQVIASLGKSGGGVGAGVVLRPVFVSVGFAVVVPVVLRYLVGPLGRRLGRVGAVRGRIGRSIGGMRARFVMHCLLLFGLVAAAAWSGTSVLFAAYLAGVVVIWFDSQDQVMVHKKRTAQNTTAKQEGDTAECIEQTQVHIDALVQTQGSHLHDHHLSGQVIYDTYLAQPVNRILRPLFFASIGFSIPIISLFKGQLVWRGLVYTIFMTIGKLLCGAWLMPFQKDHTIDVKDRIKSERTGSPMKLILGVLSRRFTSEKELEPVVAPATKITVPSTETKVGDDENVISLSISPIQPKSLYPASMLGFAMVSRGEIGFLISSVAESAGIWSGRSTPRPPNLEDTQQSSDMFIVVTWAIFLCTFIGPVAIGLLVRRVKSLEKGKDAGAINVLGSWGIEITTDSGNT